jgi:cytochrome c5
MPQVNFRLLAVASAIAIFATAAMAMGSKPAEDEDAVNARIAPVAKLSLEPAPAKAGATGNRSGEEMYNTVCHVCHAPGSPVPTSPKFGDKAAWAPRIGVGLDVLTKNAIAGKNAMPPKGGAADASELEIARAIVYMTDHSGANFKEPTAGAKIASSERSPEDIAQAACFKCHETGEKGAPKLSDKAAWTQRASTGLDALTKSVIRGHGNMPARGGMADLTDNEVKATIAYLLKRVGNGGK